MLPKNEDIIFGQYLIRFSDYKRTINQNTVDRAMAVQKKEYDESENYRKIGTILLEDFDVFLSEGDLHKALEGFESFKKKYMR